METLLRAGLHRLDVETPVGRLGGDISVGAEQPLGEFAHAGAGIESCLHGGVNNLFFRLICAQPKAFRALAEIGVFGF